MKRITLSTLAVGVALAFGSAVAQQQATPSKSGPAMAPAQVKDMSAKIEAVKVTAVVTAIDAKNRIVTLKGPEGNEFAVLADGAVKNFAQIKVGDRLVVEYFESLVVDFQKGDGIRMVSEFDDSARAKAGQRPGAAALRRVTVVSNIWAVNQAKGTVLIRGPYGHFAEVKMKDPAMLGGVKVGDQMKVTYTDAVAIGFVPAP
jgi:uncharacterized protein with beta-barrel porin domain